MEITEKKAEDAWKKLLKQIYENGKDFKDRDNRICRELMNVSVIIKDPSSVTNPIEIINSFEKWVYPPLEELESISLSRKELAGYYYNYGARIFNFNGINQLDNYIIPLLKKDPSTRRATLVLYDPERDSSLSRRDTPGCIMISLIMRDNKLNITGIFRSSDTFFGWPANIYQEYIIQNYVAKAIGCELGEIKTFSISAHLFEEQFEHVKKII